MALWWLPLGAGERTGTVRVSGLVYEWLSAWWGRRPPQPLFHSALVVTLDDVDFAIEMAPVWSSSEAHRGVVREGPVGLPFLGRFRAFRYEVRCWPGGRLPDQAYAVDSPQVLSTDRERTGRLLDAVREVPVATWGLDEQGAGEMWNSNSVVSWALAVSGHDVSGLRPPAAGRAPGWEAGLVRASARGRRADGDRDGRRGG